MADEINRASPRTQSALLQAMQEHHVTIAGQRHDLPSPFHVLATQNPLEQEGTYPLPEAQLDRFLMQIDVLYPDLDAERRMLFETTGATRRRAESVLDAERLKEIQRLVRRMPVGEGVVEAILELVRPRAPARAAPTPTSSRLGARPARQPGADAVRPRPRPLRRPPRAIPRRRRGAGRAGAAAPHGGDLRGARRRRERARHDRAGGRAGPSDG